MTNEQLRRAVERSRETTATANAFRRALGIPELRERVRFKKHRRKNGQIRREVVECMRQTHGTTASLHGR